MIATGICAVITSTLFLLYNFWALARVKRKHAREIELELEQEVPEKEGLVEKVGRKAHQLALQPASIV